MSNKKSVLIILVMSLLLGACSSNKSETVNQTTTNEVSSEDSQPAYMEKLFNKEEIINIDIQIDEETWDQMLENALAEEYVEADLLINDELISSIGIRPKGNSSLTMVATDETTDRFSFKIDFSEYVKGQRYYGLKKFVLNNNIGDATSMKEYLSYDLMNAMGIATPGYAYANVTLNGEPWGLYLAVEVMDETFVQRHFNSTDGNLYKPESMNIGGGNKELQLKNPGNQQPDGMAENQMPQPPEGMTENQMPQQPEGMPENQMPQQPEGMPENQMPQLPEGMPENQAPQLPEGTTENQMPETIEENDFRNKGNKGGMMATGGSNLVYIDDNLESYSSIFDNIETKNTDEADQYTLIKIIKNLNEGTNLDSVLDVEEILRYFAVNTFLVNLDSYAGAMKHNYYLYEENGILQILPWDMNLSFGTFQMNSASSVINFPIDSPVTDTLENSPLIAKLLEVETYKSMYHDYLQELVDDYIDSGYFEQTVNSVHALIKSFVEKDPTAFYTYDEYLAGYEAIKVYAFDRSSSIKAQLSGEQPSDSYGTIETTLNLQALGSQTMGGTNNKGGFFNRNDQNLNDLKGNQDFMATSQEVLNIIGNKTLDELSTNELKQLEALGLNEDMIQQFMMMKQKMPQNKN